MSETKRQSGIILPVFSLPSKTMGKGAFAFIDWLKDAGQSVWQILPLGPTNDGNSPYQCASSFAGNPKLIDLELLSKDGLLDEGDTDLMHAFKRGALSSSYIDFKSSCAKGLKDYALYAALKEHFGGKSWIDWDDEDIKKRKSEALFEYEKRFEKEIDYHLFVQYLFYSQWLKVKEYANAKGISILGDIPVYVPLDSADVWAEPEFFLLDDELNPKGVAGVPPDYFSEDGQNWGNPLYNWDMMKSDGYGWWIRRIDASLKFCDRLRIDHFRGFDSYWSIPYGEKSAKTGHWEQGPGISFVNVLTGWFGGERFVAEDLGILTDSVRNLLSASGLPGMKVLQFAFSPDGTSAYLPLYYDKNCICYTGTHDNTTLFDWAKNGDPKELSFAKKYLGLSKDASAKELASAVIRLGQSSTANLFMAQMQDYLMLGADARTNIPGTMYGNWEWHLGSSDLTKDLAEEIKDLTKLYSRCTIALS